MAQVKIGWSEVDMTPEKRNKISLYGQFFERITDEVESPITVTAFALESDNDQMVMVSCDIVGIGYSTIQEVRERLKSKIDLPLDKIIISAIHSHTSMTYEWQNYIEYTTGKGNRKQSAAVGLDYLSKVLPKEMAYQPLVSNEDCLSPSECLEILVSAICKAVIDAWNNRKPAYYQNAFGRAVVGLNRRVCYDDGSAKMWGDVNKANFTELEAGNDSGVELIYTYDENKELSGVIANIACPAQVVEHRSFISADYWGKVKENLQKHFGRKIQVLGLCAPAGDQCPRDLIRWVNPETPIDDPNIKRENYIERRADPSMFDISGLKVVGRRISNEIISVFEELTGELKSEGLLEHETIELSLPLRRVTISEYENAIEQIDRFIEKNRGRRLSFEDNAKLHVHAGTIGRYKLQQKFNTFKAEVHIARFGDIAIATSPFELFLDYGNQIRARSKAKQTILVQLACGCEGYLPTKKAEEGSHYSAYVSSGFTGHIGGDMLVRETLERINNKF